MTYTTITTTEYREHYNGILGALNVKGDNQHMKIPRTYTNMLELSGTGEITCQASPLQPLTLVGSATNALKEFQVEDVKRMAYASFFLNANKMGAGKTIETVAACKALGLQSILIECPKPVCGQWVKVFREWWPERADDVVLYDWNTDVVRGRIYIVNYEKLISPKAHDKFMKYVWDAFIVDEAHKIKNRNALRTKKTKEIKASRRYALTGTPIMRNPDDLWSILDFLSDEIAGRSYWNFVNYYCEVVDGFFGMEVKGLTKNSYHVEQLQKILATISCRHDELEVAQGKEVITVPLIMDKPQKAVYHTIQKLLFDELPETLTIPNGAVMRMRLLQATSSPQLCGSKFQGVKFDWIYELLESAPDEKVVIYSQWTGVLNNLRAFLTKKGIKCASYNGSQSTLARDAEKNRFCTKPEYQVLLGTIGALGTGVDGLQNASHICVFIDRDYSPEMNHQCEDRLNRMGQKKRVLCYYLECEKTADSKVAKVNWTRAEDIRKVLQDEL